MSFFGKYRYYLRSIFTLCRGIRHPWKLTPIFLKAALASPQLLDLPHENLRMWVRGRMDVWSVKEAILDKFYERYGTAVQKDWTVVDVGAAIGEFTILAAKAASEGKVIAIEPNSLSVEVLKNNLFINQIGNVEIVQRGLWSANQRLSLDLVNDEPLQAMTSLETDEGDAFMQFETQTLASLMTEYHLNQIDLLKSDSEGAEYEFLLSCNPDTLQCVKRIVMEYHNLDEIHNDRLLKDFLQSNGYNVQQWPNPVHADIGFLYAYRISPR